MLDEVKALLIGVVAMFVTQGFKLLSEWMKRDLGGVAAFVVFVLSAALVGAIDAIFAKVPLEYRDLVLFVFKWLVALLGGSGAFRVYLKLRHA